MLNIRQLKTSLFDANCYVVWPDGSTEALVVDPGPGTKDRVLKLLADNGLTLGAVLLTHGHFDHVWDAAAVADGVAEDLDAASLPPVYIPRPDLFWLDDPVEKVGLPLAHLGLCDWRKPASATPISELEWQPVPNVTLRMIPAPGHSPGSAIYLVGAEGLEEPLAFAGDVIFQGSIGRTDLPGGDVEEMDESLRTLAAVLNPETVLLPGHGPKTQWGAEKKTNPYVKRALR